MFKKSLSLSVYNWKVLLKALVCQVLILALVVAFCYLIFGGFVDDIMKIFASGNWGKLATDTFEAIGNGTFDSAVFAEQLRQSLEELIKSIQSIPNIWNRVEVSYVSFVLIICLYRLLISFSDVTVGFQLHEFMTANTARPFLWFFIKKQGESWRFVLLQTLITMPLDFLLIAGGVGLGLVLCLFFGIWALVPTVLIVLVLYALRQTLFAFWLPALVADEDGKVTGALKKGLSVIPYRFGQVFWKWLLGSFLIFAVTALSAIFIRNPVIMMAVGALPSFILYYVLKCVNFAEYFAHFNRPFFYKRLDVEGTERYNKKEERRARREKRRSKKTV
ncbi:MAG: hypothetical protein NC132_04550 [Corallococcus sp.]|nr:hypothetical protein [Corallococcus sp.]MCM1359656.1 hypothetical protein [Corallococcus sp.]MCM1395365.1 hypothetical protein [Corallococcus sp.]